MEKLKHNRLIYNGNLKDIIPNSEKFWENIINENIYSNRISNKENDIF